MSEAATIADARARPPPGWVRGYRRAWLRGDLVAGLTSAAVVIPKAIAFALVAGLPAQAGLAVACVPMAVYAILGSSRALSVSSTTTIAMLAATHLAAVVPDGDPARLLSASALLSLLVGAVLVVAGLLRLGFVANFLSDPVLAGFKAGIGVVIVLDQLPKLLGIHVGAGGVLAHAVETAAALPRTHAPTAVVSAALLALVLAAHRFAPRLPAPLIAVAVAIGAAWLLDLRAAGVAMTGAVPAGLPLPALPDLALARALLPGALGIALMSFAESIAAGRAFARPDEPAPPADRELLALGAANLAGGFFRCLPAGGGTSQTAVNAGAGARSQLSCLATAAVALATMLALGPLLALLPVAALAALVVATSLPLLDPGAILRIGRIRRMECWWAVAACAGVVLLGTLHGILVAVAISVLALLHHGTHPPVYLIGRRADGAGFAPLPTGAAGPAIAPGLLAVRTEGRMHFASAPHVGERMWELVRAAQPRVVVLECSAVPDIEYTALARLTAAEAKLHGMGVRLWLAGLNPAARAVVERSELGGAHGGARIFDDLDGAVAAYTASLETT